MIGQLKRWLPNRPLIVVADSSYAGIELLNAVRTQVSFITRLRLDAALYDPAPVRPQGKRGPKRLKGKRQPTLTQRIKQATLQWQTLGVAQWYDQKDKEVQISTDTAIWYHSGMAPLTIRGVLIEDKEGKKDPVALLCTNTEFSAEQIIAFFIKRWSMEVTFEQTRVHLGVETGRQWADLAISRTTPALMGLFSIVALWADALQKQHPLTLQATAWYHKSKPTFSDALAAVKSSIWQNKNYCISTLNEDMIQIPKVLLTQLTNLLATAA
jgi:DDE superfamily endonuclease